MRVAARFSRGVVPVALVCLLLVGCSGSPAPPVRTSATNPTPTLTPTSEALRAEKVYRDFLAVTNRFTGREEEYERMRPLLTKAAYTTEVAGFKKLKSRGLRIAGATELETFELQQMSASGLSAYACVDQSKVHVVDRNGKDVTPPARPDQETVLLRFSATATTMLLAGEETWSGQSIC